MKTDQQLTDTRYYPLEDIKAEFLRYAPHYAQEEAKQAIAKVHELQMQGLIRSGLYYVVLVDLVGSTQYGVDNGNEALAHRIKCFVMASFNAMNEIRMRNAGLFLKEIGDAVLFVFSHFPDVVSWLHAFRKYLVAVQGAEPFIIRTCVHVGEVSLEGVNPLSLAVSQAFKMEKEVKGGDVVLTSVAYNCAWPSIARAHHGFERYGETDLVGSDSKVSLHRLLIHDEDDLQRIVEEDLENE